MMQTGMELHIMPHKQVHRWAPSLEKDKHKWCAYRSANKAWIWNVIAAQKLGQNLQHQHVRGALAFPETKICFKLTLSVKQRISALPACTFETSWTEHAQKHQVNRSSEKAPMANSLLKRPCTCVLSLSSLFFHLLFSCHPTYIFFITFMLYAHFISNIPFSHFSIMIVL